MSSYFPIFVNKQDNKALMEEVGREELLTVLNCFQKDKTLSPHGILVSSFLGVLSSLKMT